MTEEDQKLVALAALHGARFGRKDGDHGHKGMWVVVNLSVETSKWTIGRAAEYYLWKHGMRSDAEHEEYDNRTYGGHATGQDVSEAFITSVLA